MNVASDSGEEQSLPPDPVQVKFELARLTAELQRASSRRTLNAWIAITIPALLGLAWLAYTATEVRSLQGKMVDAEKSRDRFIRERDTAREEASRLRRENEKLRAENDKLDASIQQKRAELEVANQELTAIKQQQQVVKREIEGQLASARTSASANPAALKTITSVQESIGKTLDDAAGELGDQPLVEDNRVARIFVFVLDQQQKEQVRAAIPAIESAAPFAKVANVLGNTGRRDRDVQVRFFREQDREEAQRILDALKQTILSPDVPARISYVIDPDSIGRGRKFQVWLTRNALKH